MLLDHCLLLTCKQLAVFLVDSHDRDGDLSQNMPNKAFLYWQCIAAKVASQTISVHRNYAI